MVSYFPSPPSPPSSLGEVEGTGLVVAVVLVVAGDSVTVGDAPSPASLVSPQAVRGVSKPNMSKTLIDCFEFIQVSLSYKNRFTRILMTKTLKLLSMHTLRFCMVRKHQAFIIATKCQKCKVF
jgi:hypothetical protein